MEWSDDVIVLSARPHAETAALVMVLTRTLGRHGGLVQGGQSRKKTAGLQAGTLARAHWRGRLSEHMGTLTLEPVRSFAAGVFDDPLRLGALASACALIETSVGERDPHPVLYDGLLTLLHMLEGPVWDAAYVQWEMGLLQEIGFGLDLAHCAVTGGNDTLAYVSPRTGRAVSAAAGEEWADKLLPLPDFLAGRGGGDGIQIVQGLDLTGHFLTRALPMMPAARILFYESYRTKAHRLL